MIGTVGLSLRDAHAVPKTSEFWNGLSRKEQWAFALTLPEQQMARGKNLVSDNFASRVFNRTMQGPNITDPYDFDASGGGAAFGFILLMTTDSEPTYTDQTSEFTRPADVSGSANGDDSNGAAKRFILDDNEDHLIRSLDTVDGREGLQFVSRFLYAPFQGISSNIRSIGVYFRDDTDIPLTSASWTGRIARIRLKDGNGAPIIINKTSSQTLLVEYTFTYLNV